MDLTCEFDGVRVLDVRATPEAAGRAAEVDGTRCVWVRLAPVAVEFGVERGVGDRRRWLAIVGFGRCDWRGRRGRLRRFGRALIILYRIVTLNGGNDVLHHILKLLIALVRLSTVVCIRDRSLGERVDYGILHFTSSNDVRIIRSKGDGFINGDAGLGEVKRSDTVRINLDSGEDAFSQGDLAVNEDCFLCRHGSRVALMKA